MPIKRGFEGIVLVCLCSHTHDCSQGKRYGSGSVDEQVLGRLGDVIGGMKDDFIVVHLQEPCSLCREYISDAPR